MANHSSTMSSRVMTSFAYGMVTLRQQWTRQAGWFDSVWSTMCPGIDMFMSANNDRPTHIVVHPLCFTFTLVVSFTFTLVVSFTFTLVVSLTFTLVVSLSHRLFHSLLHWLFHFHIGCFIHFLIGLFHIGLFYFHVGCFTFT